jgi:hypothetical protein
MKILRIIQNADVSDLNETELHELLEALIDFKSKIKEEINDRRQQMEYEKEMEIEDTKREIGETVNEILRMRQEIERIGREIEEIIGEDIREQIDVTPPYQGDDIDGLRHYLLMLNVEHKDVSEEIEHLRRVRSEV